MIPTVTIPTVVVPDIDNNIFVNAGTIPVVVRGAAASYVASIAYDEVRGYEFVIPLAAIQWNGDTTGKQLASLMIRLSTGTLITVLNAEIVGTDIRVKALGYQGFYERITDKVTSSYTGLTRQTSADISAYPPTVKVRSDGATGTRYIRASAADRYGTVGSMLKTFSYVTLFDSYLEASHTTYQTHKQLELLDTTSNNGIFDPLTDAVQSENLTDGLVMFTIPATIGDKIKVTSYGGSVTFGTYTGAPYKMRLKYKSSVATTVTLTASNGTVLATGKVLAANTWYDETYDVVAFGGIGPYVTIKSDVATATTITFDVARTWYQGNIYLTAHMYEPVQGWVPNVTPINVDILLK